MEEKDKIRKYLIDNAARYQLVVRESDDRDVLLAMWNYDPMSAEAVKIAIECSFDMFGVVVYRENMNYSKFFFPHELNWALATASTIVELTISEDVQP